MRVVPGAGPLRGVGEAANGGDMMAITMVPKWRGDGGAGEREVQGERR